MCNSYVLVCNGGTMRHDHLDAPEKQMPVRNIPIFRTSVVSRNSRFNQWECVFWLECCVSQQTKRFKMADIESCEYFPMPWIRAFRRYIFISNWVNYCPNYKIKRKFVFAFHVTDNSAQITIILGPKAAPQNVMRATFDELLLSFFGKRPYNR